MNDFDFRTFTDELNKAAHSHRIGKLMEIRADLHGKPKRGDRIFRLVRKNPDGYQWANHYGGRKELQFNIGSDGKMLRFGVAFSFETSRSFHRKDINNLIDKVKLFNDCLRQHPDFYGDMRMSHWRNKKIGSSESAPAPIPPEMAEKGVFVFLGKQRPISEVNLDAVLEDMDRLLPLYKYIEGKGRIQPLSTNDEKEFEPRSGRRSTLTATTANYARMQLDVNLRHNMLQKALERKLIARHGSGNVFHDMRTPVGTFVDLAVRQSREEYWYYEIKTYESPRACIREAIGQLLEYAFWPGSQEACRLIIVGETAPDREDREYLQCLERRFSLTTLTIEYEQIVL